MDRSSWVTRAASFLGSETGACAITLVLVSATVKDKPMAKPITLVTAPIAWTTVVAVKTKRKLSDRTLMVSFPFNYRLSAPPYDRSDQRLR
jgi:hypothetical protein